MNIYTSCRAKRADRRSPQKIAAPFWAMADGGKTSAAKGIVEHLLDTGSRVCIIDPTSVWWASSRRRPASRAVIRLGYVSFRAIDL
jgi:hypothetical protein